MRVVSSVACAVVVGGLVALCLSIPAAPALAAERGPRLHEFRLDASTAERVRFARERLEPADANPRSLELLGRRAAPSSLSLLVVGCDFADSLMVGRDRSQFPGWPEPRRTAQVIPPQGSGPYVPVPMFTAHDSTYFDLQMQRVDDYFRTVSFGKFDLRWEVHGTIVNLPEAMGYYGSEDSAGVRAVRMAKQVIDAIDDAVDFSAYDTLVLIHAGAGQETDVNGDSPAQIFSNYLDVRDFERAVEADYLDEPFLRTGEAAIEHVLVLPEAQAQDPPASNGLGGFFDVRGVYAFELGLRMGMLSLADFTPGNFPDSQGIGNFGLMGYGLFTGLGTVPSAPSAINRYLMGWVEAVEVREDADLRIGAMDAVGAVVSDTLLVRVPITDREYWLVEYRLQDPDGDLFYSFERLNPNNLPDFFDADSDSGDGRPTSPFDPTTDTWEDELGAEWDWFMSENPARTPDGCQRGGGSGLYIWHVDERVIQDALLAGTNTVNSDAQRKGVDVEEADGIQDLDSLAGGLYLLGADNDCWRAPANTEFGPTTSPATLSNDGFDTGIRFHSFSTAATDTLPKVEFGGFEFCTGFVYRSAMTFSVEFGVSTRGPREIGRARTSGFALTADMRAGDFFGPDGATGPDGTDELIAIADSGRVLIWQDGVEPWNGVTPVFFRTEGEDLLGPPAVQVAGTTGDPAAVVLAPTTGRPPLVVLGRDGLQAFDDETIAADGSLVTGFFGWSEGRVENDGFWVRAGDTSFVLEGYATRTGSTPAVRTLYQNPVEERLDAAIVHTTSNSWVVGVRTDSTSATITTFDAAGVPMRRITVDEGVVAGSLTPLGAGPTRMEPVVGWVDGTGRVRLTGLGEEEARWDRSSLESGLPASGLVAAREKENGATIVAVSLGGALHVLDTNLRSLPNFPYVVERGGVGQVVGMRAMPPVLVDLTGDGQVEVVWHEPAGTIHAVALDGRSLDGWPIAGPAEPISSPVVADLDGDGDFDLAVAGRFENLVSIDAPNQDFEGRVTGEVRVYDLEVPVSAYAPWRQGGGDAANRAVGIVVDGLGSVGGDHGLVVYPNPTIDGRARVRVRVPRAGRFTLSVYTLEGQQVLSAGPYPVPAGAFFEQEITLDEVAAGTYLCRVSGEGLDARGIVAVVR